MSATRQQLHMVYTAMFKYYSVSGEYHTYNEIREKASKDLESITNVLDLGDVLFVTRKEPHSPNTLVDRTRKSPFTYGFGNKPVGRSTKKRNFVGNIPMFITVSLQNSSLYAAQQIVQDAVESGEEVFLDTHLKHVVDPFDVWSTSTWGLREKRYGYLKYLDDGQVQSLLNTLEEALEQLHNELVEYSLNCEHPLTVTVVDYE